MKQILLTIIAIIGLFPATSAQSKAPQWESININNTFGLNNSSINTIFQDRKGMMWIGTWDGLNRYDGNAMMRFNSIPNNPASLSNPVVRDILEESDSVLWIITENGINRFSKRHKVSRQFYLNCPTNISFIEKAFQATISKNGMVVANYNGGQLFIYDRIKHDFVAVHSEKSISEKIVRMKFDSNNNLILCSNTHIYTVKVTNKTIKIISKVQLPKGITTIAFDNTSRLWIQKGEQLSYYTSNRIFDSNMLVPAQMTCIVNTPKGYVVGTNDGYYTYMGDAQPEHNLPNVCITAAMYGKQDILWIGTDGRGLYQNFECEQSILSYKIGERSLPVRAILRRGNRLFVGTKGEGMLVYEINQDRQLDIQENHNVGTGRSYNAVFALCNSLNDRIWVGTDGIGLQYYDKGKLHYMQYANEADRNKIFSVYSIIESNDSTLFLGCSGSGLLKIIWKDNIIKSVKQYGKLKDTDTKSNIVYSIIEDGDIIWAGTRGGGLMRLNTRNDEVKFYRNDPSNSESLWNNDIISLYKDTKNRLWIGMSQGLDMIKTNEDKPHFNHYNDIELPDLYIHSIQEDNKGNIWVSTSNGVSRLNKYGDPLNFSHSDGLQGNEFSDGAGMTWDGGSTILFGGTNGISIISPQLLEDDSFMPELQLCAVKADHIAVPLADSFTFSHNMATCQFSFAIMDFISNDRCDLSYRLERHSLWSNDEEWVNIGNRREILLNRLLPGDYILYVRQSNSTHVWSTKLLEIPFHVSYPIWAQWWAIVIYISIISTIIWCSYQNKKRKIFVSHERELEKQAIKYKEEIHHAKLRFFASVASRFSSQITHIYHTIEDIRSHNHEQKLDEYIGRISDNLYDMDRLIKRLSEIQSADDDDTVITPETFSVDEAIKNSLDPYAAQIIEHNVFLDIDIDSSILLVTDKMIFLKAVHNILNYVFRCLDDKTALTIGCESTPEILSIVISYTGYAPKKNELEDIFNSYKALDIYENNMKHGEDVKYFRLTISNEMAKRLGGMVKIESVTDNRTMIKISVRQMPKATTVKEKSKEKEQSKIENIIDIKRQKLLIINDDKDMTELIKTSLEQDFKITVTSESEFSPISEINHSFDLIIFEPASPENLSLITTIKTAEGTKFTPIIAVCSSSDKDTGAKLLRQGANSILEKPFRRDYLKAMVERELTATDQMRNYSDSPISYMRKIGTRNMSKETIEFLYKVVNTISKHYQNEGYNANMLAADMAMSRTQLYRKFKQFTEISPTDFILEYRMNKAEKLLKTTERSISEIVSLCGFRNRAFFYREFAALHNCSPKEFRKNNLHK